MVDSQQPVILLGLQPQAGLVRLGICLFSATGHLGWLTASNLSHCRDCSHRQGWVRQGLLSMPSWHKGGGGCRRAVCLAGHTPRSNGQGQQFMWECCESLLQRLLVVLWGGRHSSIAKGLKVAAAALYSCSRLFWVLHSHSHLRLTIHSHRFLSHTFR